MIKLLFMMLIAAPAMALAQTTQPPQPALERLATEIREEATRISADPAGRPLPLATHWNGGEKRDSFTPDSQLPLLDAGHHILPWFMLPQPNLSVSPDHLAYYEPLLKRCAELRLPICFISPQWEHLLSEPPYLNLPPAENPNTIPSDGKPRAELSPMGPVAPWREVARQWTQSFVLKRLEQIYPDPPMVMFLSNNEQPKLTWSAANDDVRFVREFGSNKDADFKREFFAKRWSERYRAFIQSMRAGIDNPQWRAHSIFVAYEAFGPSFIGRWSGWDQYSLHTPGHISPWPLVWDGGSPSYYTHDWNPINDYSVYSPQIESMNWIFMLDQAFKENPRFWFELSIWDGHNPGGKTDKRQEYAAKGQTYSPERYKGFVQFGMWLTRPRAAREFRGYLEKRQGNMIYFEQIMDAVDRVYANPTLKEFWRHGALVPNRAHQHPYHENIPAEYQKVDRWYLLDTTLDPPRPWKLETEIPVFSIALVMGNAPHRRWLVYTHSPLVDRKDVGITVPGYGKINVDVTQAGSFYLLDESHKSCTPL